MAEAVLKEEHQEVGSGAGVKDMVASVSIGHGQSGAQQSRARLNVVQWP